MICKIVMLNADSASNATPPIEYHLVDVFIKQISLFIVPDSNNFNFNSVMLLSKKQLTELEKSLFKLIAEGAIVGPF